MRNSEVRRTGACLGLLLGAVSATAEARIDATTPNQSTGAETVLTAEGGAAKQPIVISEKTGV